MKNFISSLFLPAIFTVMLISPANSAPKMRDMSLSVEETNRQLATPQSARDNVADPGFYNDSGMESDSGFGNGYGGGYGNGGYGNGGYGIDPNAPIDLRNLDDINSLNNMRSDNYIGNNLPNPPRRIGPPIRVSNKQGFINRFCSAGYIPQTNSSIADQSCQDTQRQQACERFARAAVNVQRILSQAIDCEASTSNYRNSDCDGLDATRLDLLKQNWQDEDLAYTILFLPDMVLNSTENCSYSSRRGNNQ
jgi:hypothetical protein